MARKRLEVPITVEGRDKGKLFIITEMPAAQAEKWAVKAFLALSRSGVDIPEDVGSMGMIGIAILGLKALGGIRNDEAFDLMDEMLTCVTIRPDPKQPLVERPLHESDTEEVVTRVHLREKVFELHVGFSFADGASKLGTDRPTSPPQTPTTRTSRVRSER